MDGEGCWRGGGVAEEELSCSSSERVMVSGYRLRAPLV